MKYLVGWGQKWPVFAGGVILIGIVHLVTTLLMPYAYQTNGFQRLVRNLPAHSFVILPQARPRSQVLPYQMPDARMAICRFDVANGPVSVRALLPEPGWTLSLYAPGGEAYYSFPATGERRFVLNLLVMPPGNRFMGPAGDPRNQSVDVSRVMAPSRYGIAVIRAPINGRTFTAQTQKDLTAASCKKQSF